MKKDRRDFIKMAGLAGAGLTTGNSIFNHNDLFMDHPFLSSPDLQELPGTNLIGPYGPWAAGLLEKDLPSFSFRRNDFNDIGKWREEAKTRLAERLAIPSIGNSPTVKVLKEYTYDGLHIEEMTWQLPYGRPTEAILLKPQGAKGKLPGILAFHDHAGNKYFGTRKITKTSDAQHQMMTEHQKGYYEGRAWANEIAKRGYVVLVSDAFPFASRRVMMQDIPVSQRRGLTDENPEDTKNIEAYNRWAGDHEHIMAKSLFSAGITWPGVFLAEDQKALDILSCQARCRQQ
jgi:hypothetical protein